MRGGAVIVQDAQAEALPQAACGHSRLKADRQQRSHQRTADGPPHGAQKQQRRGRRTDVLLFGGVLYRHQAGRLTEADADTGDRHVECDHGVAGLRADAGEQQKTEHAGQESGKHQRLAAAEPARRLPGTEGADDDADQEWDDQRTRVRRTGPVQELKQQRQQEGRGEDAGRAQETRRYPDGKHGITEHVRRQKRFGRPPFLHRQQPQRQQRAGGECGDRPRQPREGFTAPTQDQQNAGDDRHQQHRAGVVDLCLDPSYREDAQGTAAQHKGNGADGHIEPENPAP